jgi:hypothetical protein
MRRRSAGEQRGSPPNSSIRPCVGRIRSSSIRIVVVLPAPFGPRNPKTSRLHLEVEVDDAALVAVELAQAFGADDGAHGVTLTARGELRTPDRRRRRCRARRARRP